MSTDGSLSPGATLEGPYWSEPVRIVASRRLGGLREIETEGLRTERFYRSTLSPAVLPASRIETTTKR